jgi:NADH-quinone oxidoreductase subunit F
MDDTTDMVAALRAHLQIFSAHESCGQCTPCREGSGWIAKVVRNIEAGHGSAKDLEMLLDVCDNMKGKTVCVLSDAIAGTC